MTDPKQVELTEAEKGALWTWWNADFPAPSVLCETVASIVAAREAEAKSEGFSDGIVWTEKQKIEVWVKALDDKIRRVEALAADWLDEVDWSDGRNNYGDNEAYEKCARQLRAALAEPTEPQ